MFCMVTMIQDKDDRKRGANVATEKQDMFVTKANELIQKSRYDLTLPQQKIVLFLVSQLNPFSENMQIEFRIADFCKAVGMNASSGENFKDLRQNLRKIKNTSWEILQPKQTADGRLCASEVSWIGHIDWYWKADGKREDGSVSVTIDERLRPYLLNLHGNFTRYELMWVLCFKSKYSIRWYEYCKSIHFYDLKPYKTQIPIDELKRILGAEKYQTWQALKERALQPATAEINDFTDKRVSYKAIKRGRTVVSVEVVVESKDTIEAIRTRLDNLQKLHINPDQMTLFDDLEPNEELQNEEI